MAKRLRPWQLAFWITYEHSRQAMGQGIPDMLRLRWLRSLGSTAEGQGENSTHTPLKKHVVCTLLVWEAWQVCINCPDIGRRWLRANLFAAAVSCERCWEFTQFLEGGLEGTAALRIIHPFKMMCFDFRVVA